MVIKRYIKYTILFLIMVFFVPIGVGQLMEGLGSQAESTEQAAKDGTTRLNNPNAFNREYKITHGTTRTYYRLIDHESKLRTVYDNFGIQLYFVEYELDFENPHNSSEDALAEVKTWLVDKGIDPYGIYHIVAEYRVDYDSPSYDENIKYWNLGVDCHILYGEEVDAWWNTEIQAAFEKACLLNEYRPGTYNNYEGFISSMYIMQIDGCNSVESITSNNITGDVFVFCLCTLVPIGLFCVVLAHDLRKHRQLKKQQAEEEKRRSYNEVTEILQTPIKTLEQEYAESLKDKYK